MSAAWDKEGHFIIEGSTHWEDVMRMPLKTQLPATGSEACEARAKRRNSKPTVTCGDCSCLSTADGTRGHNVCKG